MFFFSTLSCLSDPHSDSATTAAHCALSPEYYTIIISLKPTLFTSGLVGLETFSDSLTKMFGNRFWPQEQTVLPLYSLTAPVTSGCPLRLTEIPPQKETVTGRSVSGHSWQHPEDVIIGTACIFRFRYVTPNLSGCKGSARHPASPSQPLSVTLLLSVHTLLEKCWANSDPQSQRLTLVSH